jgi:hypothetical protein
MSIENFKNPWVDEWKRGGKLHPDWWGDEKVLGVNNSNESIDEIEDSKPYPPLIQKGLDAKLQSAYTAAAIFDIANNQVSFRKMDALERHNNSVFNSHHFYRVISFQKENAEKEELYNKGIIPAGNDSSTDYLKCSPALNGMINRLYDWHGSKKIYKTEVQGRDSIMSNMKAKGLTSSEMLFTGLDSNGKQSHYTKKDPVKLSKSITEWAKSETELNGVGFFLVSVCGGYHSLLLVVDRRGSGITFRLLDQHGNQSTGSSSPFDRLIAHSGLEIDNYFLKMLSDWYDVRVNDDGEIIYNADILLLELKRD